MVRLINEAIEEQKALWEEEGGSYSEKEVRLCVYENIRDNLKVIMSDVAYN